MNNPFFMIMNILFSGCLRCLRTMILLVVLVVAGVPCRASQSANGIKDSELSALLKQGQRFFKEAKQDSALSCFSRVENAYREDMSVENKEVCVRALLGKWVILYSSYFDYPGAFEALLKAKSISDDNALEIPRIDVYLAGMYQTIASESDDAGQFAAAMDYYRKAVETSAVTGDYATADLAFTNAVQLAAMGKVDADISKMYRSYRSIKPTTNDLRRDFNAALYACCMAMKRKESAKAVGIIDRAIRGIPDKPEYLRMKMIGYLMRAQASLGLPDAGERRRCLDEALKFADDHSVHDAMVDILMMMSTDAGASGDALHQREYKLRALELKDSISYNSKCLQVDKMRFLYSLRQEQEKTAAANAAKRLRDYIVLFLAGLVVTVVIFLVVLRKKNRHLRHNAETLYRHSIESMGKRLPEAEDKEEPAEAAGKSAKYVSSSLNEEASGRLSQAIEEYASTSQEIYSADFSLARLSEAVGSNPNYISQAVNERFGCNFNTFVNRYRVREACRRFVEDAASRLLTIEAVASEVGFKSRSAFINAFKRETGLTPSEYRKQAARMSAM